ncbi:uncharacterized protein SETTUDRAFT_107546 [Exserohilum turcica Et28A]|uniref:Nuclear GTPase SLIP-GC n=1 Tax=Exserohilum turcicum (strain 28A) TaxID=671987 RepID=R0K626_EXST2|nr:uncharacterized protein SETTUDRAFT_107546 [Exserohilum turcica Et28A]EOA88473.1 hypothetical protein SETTUDRAFT_107546 [Exserohilum turcica Et28A]
MDWDNLERQVRALLPEQPLKENRCWIGILSHKWSVPDKLRESDIGWFVGNRTSTSQKILERYRKLHGLQDIQLSFKNALVGNDDLLEHFLKPNDDLIVFMAINPVQASARVATSPLPVRARSKIHPAMPCVSTSSPDKSNQEVLDILHRNIRHIIKLQNPDVLEAGVAQAVQILNSIKRCISDQEVTNGEAAACLENIEQIIPQAERKRIVIGVIGNTGAGKSSVINALLEEERIVPTNCMRACTAVVTEISWNDCTDASSKYRAEIEFISATDWERELTTLMQEFLCENGTLSRDAQDPNSDAGVAWAKFHAVYPHVAKNALHQWDIPTLMSIRPVANVLGTTKTICTARSGKLYEKLEEYVDSKEKVPLKGKGGGKKGSHQMEFWPLVKDVKIYTRSSALSTGAVIVDLPGIQDSNAARAAVAESYIKQCTGLWIVAPINRAVDDKNAKTLLGDSFKRQLKYDGGIANVTFICSKTDDISVTEAIHSLGLEEEAANFEQQYDACNQKLKEVKDKILDLRESRKVYKLAYTNASQDIDTWEELQEQFDKGRQPYAPLIKTKKRKVDLKQQPRKSLRIIEDDSDDDLFDCKTERSESESEFQSKAERVRLSDSDIKARLKELKTVKKNARDEVIRSEEAIFELNNQFDKLKAEGDMMRVKVCRMCIAERNVYSKTAIQQHFAAGIKEMDQQDAEQDEDNFDPEKEIRDYDQVAQSLPVFCVSSRAYQKICGHMRKDDRVSGFTNADDTGIPQLQAHCRKITEPGRIQTSRNFLHAFCQLLNSFKLLTSDNKTGVKATSLSKEQRSKLLELMLEGLTADTIEAVHACIKEIRSELKLHIFDKCPKLIADAIEAAPGTACAWGQKGPGGLVWSSYKAVISRYGVFESSAAGKRDFNSDLVGPIMKRLPTAWERTFQISIPKAFAGYIQSYSKLLWGLYEDTTQCVDDIGIVPANLFLLKKQVGTNEQLLQGFHASLISQMNEFQRDASRTLTPSIAEAMHSVYVECAAERGQGAFKRMKGRMEAGVDKLRHTMFHGAMQKLENDLDYMCKKLQKSMNAKSKDISARLKADYMHALGGKDDEQPTASQPKKEANFRMVMRDILEGVDAQFESIANGDISLFKAAAQADIHDEELGHEDEEKHSSAYDSAQGSVDEEANDNSDKDDTGSTSRNQAYVEEGTDNDE